MARVDLIPDGVLLASQWFDRLAAKGWRPEARLFVEILKLAIEDLHARPPANDPTGDDHDRRRHRNWRQRRGDARAWFEGDGGIVSFALCCDVLDIDAFAARSHLVGELGPGVEPANAAPGTASRAPRTSTGRRKRHDSHHRLSRAMYRARVRESRAGDRALRRPQRAPAF